MARLSPNTPSSARDWLRSSSTALKQDRRAVPKYYIAHPDSLVTEATPLSFQVGIGDDIISTILPALESAQSEIILVTCFWANSSSLKSLSASLRNLSARCLSRGTERIRVRICLSSLSLWQKLFQTSSLSGHVYTPSQWRKKLLLPPPEELQGLDLEVKSIFVRPFSVMHPKFVIVDRERVFLPSCNISWEEWFEGCVEMRGPVVQQFVRFWEEFWRGPDDVEPQLTPSPPSSPNSTSQDYIADTVKGALGPAHVQWSFLSPAPVSSIFLPSPHHVNPRFRPFPWQSPPPPPSTPLNTFLLYAINTASSAIYVQTPNLTSPPVLSALFNALRRGVNVHIVTSERLMILEQLGTAGTTTARCVKRLLRRYARLPKGAADEEAGLTRAGELLVEYFRPRRKEPREPVQSHLKLTLVDKSCVVLGSGNMDRASWYTSQELGLAFFSEEFAAQVKAVVDEALEGRKKTVFDSRE